MELIDNPLQRDIGFIIVFIGLWIWMVYEGRVQNKRDKEFMDFWERQNQKKEESERNSS